MNIPQLQIAHMRPKFPIIQGGMGVRISLSGLASAVANAGGIGIISRAGFSRDMYALCLDTGLVFAGSSMSAQKPSPKRSETIEIKISTMGQDIVFLVTGGAAHIGAVATAYVSDKKHAIVNVLSLPGHREAELAAELAETASLAIGHTVAVLVGIHLDSPARGDIDDIVEEARRKMRQLLNSWKFIVN